MKLENSKFFKILFHYSVNQSSKVSLALALYESYFNSKTPDWNPKPFQLFIKFDFPFFKEGF